MSRRRLLALGYFFPPLAGGGVHRLLSFARHLPEHGWDVTVVCAGERDYWIRDETLLAQVPAGTEVIRVTGGSALAALLRTGRGGEGGRRRGRTFAGLRSLADWWLVPDSYVGWAARARRAAERRIAAGGIDALLSTSPPDSVHLAALEAAERHRLPWIADCRDPWVGLHFRTPPSAWHRRRHEALERRVLAGADLVLATTRTHLEALGRNRGPGFAPAVHLPNGFVPAPAAPAAGEPPDPDHFRLAFTGTLSLADDAATLFEAVHEVLARHPEARRRLRVDLVGPYDLDEEDRAVALGLKGIVTFAGPRSHAESRAAQRRADALLLWMPHGAGYRFAVPGKLYEYLDSGRPVVALLPADHEASALVLRAGGVVLPPGDRTALALALETRYMAWRRDGRVAGARPAWLDEHARPQLAAQLARRLDALIGEAP